MNLAFILKQSQPTREEKKKKKNPEKYTKNEKGANMEGAGSIFFLPKYIDEMLKRKTVVKATAKDTTAREKLSSKGEKEIRREKIRNRRAGGRQIEKAHFWTPN